MGTHIPGWKDELVTLLKTNNKYRIDGKVASNKTQQERSTYLFQFMHELWAMEYKVMPKGIRPKHIKAVCEKYEAAALAAATIQTRISFLRALCKWIGKPNMIGDIKEFFDDPDVIKRSYQATHDKSWDVPDIDKYRIIFQILADYPHIGFMLLLMDAFGLRRKEAVMLRPYLEYRDGMLHIRNGAKGGRVRSIPVTNEYQIEVMQRVLQFVGKDGRHMGDPNYDLKSNLSRYSRVVRQYGIKKTGLGALGITGHGLRAGFAMNQMESKGLVPSVRGGEANQLPAEQEKRVREEVSQQLGHNRPQITTAYSGPTTRAGIKRMKK